MLAGYLDAVSISGIRRRRLALFLHCLVPDVSRAGARRDAARLAQTARARHAVSAGVDRALLRRSAGGVLRRVGALPAADGRAARAAGLATAGRSGWRSGSPRNWRSGWASRRSTTSTGTRIANWRGSCASPPRTSACGWTTSGGCATTWRRRAPCRLTKTQTVRPGDFVVTSELGARGQPHCAGVPWSGRWRSGRRFRCGSSGSESHSGYSTIAQRSLAVRDLERADRPRARGRSGGAPSHAGIPADERAGGRRSRSSAEFSRWKTIATAGRRRSAVVALKSPAARDAAARGVQHSGHGARRGRCRSGWTDGRWHRRPIPGRATTSW